MLAFKTKKSDARSPTRLYHSGHYVVGAVPQNPAVPLSGFRVTVSKRLTIVGRIPQGWLVTVCDPRRLKDRCKLSPRKPGLPRERTLPDIDDQFDAVIVEESGQFGGRSTFIPDSEHRVCHWSYRFLQNEGR